jgi:rhodanese-related sulfurtransferase
MEELKDRIGGNSRDFVLLDMREKDAFEAGHVPARATCRAGQLELRVNTELPIRRCASSPTASSARFRRSRRHPARAGLMRGRWRWTAA